MPPGDIRYPFHPDIFHGEPSIVRNGDAEKFVAAKQRTQSQDRRAILSYDPRISIYARFDLASELERARDFRRRRSGIDRPLLG